MQMVYVNLYDSRALSKFTTVVCDIFIARCKRI